MFWISDVPNPIFLGSANSERSPGSGFLGSANVRPKGERSPNYRLEGHVTYRSNRTDTYVTNVYITFGSLTLHDL